MCASYMEVYGRSGDKQRQNGLSYMEQINRRRRFTNLIPITYENSTNSTLNVFK